MRVALGRGVPRLVTRDGPIRLALPGGCQPGRASRQRLGSIEPQHKRCRGVRGFPGLVKRIRRELVERGWGSGGIRPARNKRLGAVVWRDRRDALGRGCRSRPSRGRNSGTAGGHSHGDVGSVYSHGGADAVRALGLKCVRRWAHLRVGVWLLFEEEEGVQGAEGDCWAGRLAVICLSVLQRRCLEAAEAAAREKLGEVEGGFMEAWVC